MAAATIALIFSAAAIRWAIAVRVGEVQRCEGSLRAGWERRLEHRPIVLAPNVAGWREVRSECPCGGAFRPQSVLSGRAARQRTGSGHVQSPACSVVSVADAPEIVELASIHSSGNSSGCSRPCSGSDRGWWSSTPWCACMASTRTPSPRSPPSSASARAPATLRSRRGARPPRSQKPCDQGGTGPAWK